MESKGITELGHETTSVKKKSVGVRSYSVSRTALFLKSPAAETGQTVLLERRTGSSGPEDGSTKMAFRARP